MVRKYESTHVRRDQIINAARVVIVKYGSENVTVKRISEEVGISEATIYRHFKSKREILSLLIEDIKNTLLSEIEFNSTGSPFTEETLERVIMHHISNVIKRRGVSFQVIAEIISLGDKRLNKMVYDVINSYIERIKYLLAEGVKAGVIGQNIDIEAVATVFFSLTQGLINMWALSQYKLDIEKKYTSAWFILRKALNK